MLTAHAGNSSFRTPLALFGGTEGPEGLRDRSHRPHHSPNATQAEVIDKIVHLRRNYHFGPAKIVMYLARYHDVAVSVSGVWRILKRLDLSSTGD